MTGIPPLTGRLRLVILDHNVAVVILPPDMNQPGSLNELGEALRRAMAGWSILLWNGDVFDVHADPALTLLAAQMAARLRLLGLGAAYEVGRAPTAPDPGVR